MKLLLGIVISLSLTSGALAAISPVAKQNYRAPSSILRSSGSIHGGQAGIGFSLLGVKTKVAKSQKLERLMISVGDGGMQKQIGSPGYFQIENNEAEKRVVINFPQTLNSAFNEKTFQQNFLKSPFVKSSQLIFEPEGQTTSLVLNLKKAVSIRAIPVVGTKKQTAQLLVDIFDDSLLAKKGQIKGKTSAKAATKPTLKK